MTYLAFFIFGTGCGFGFAVTWRSWPWLVIMGRATRHWLTMRSKARATYAFIYDDMSQFPDQAFPKWYRRYVAFRETAHL